MHRRRTFLPPLPVAALLILGGAAGPLSPGIAAQAGASGYENDLPYWVWRTLPQVFPEYMPGSGGYLAFGFEWNLGDQLPVGLMMTDGSIPRIRSNPESLGPVGVNGTSPNVEAYRAFLLAAANDPRFTAENILPIIRYSTRLSLLQRLRYRYLEIPRAREALLRLAER